MNLSECQSVITRESVDRLDLIRVVVTEVLDSYVARIFDADMFASLVDKIKRNLRAAIGYSHGSVADQRHTVLAGSVAGVDDVGSCGINAAPQIELSAKIHGKRQIGVFRHDLTRIDFIDTVGEMLHGVHRIGYLRHVDGYVDPVALCAVARIELKGHVVGKRTCPRSIEAALSAVDIGGYIFGELARRSDMGLDRHSAAETGIDNAAHGSEFGAHIVGIAAATHVDSSSDNRLIGNVAFLTACLNSRAGDIAGFERKSVVASVVSGRN